MLGVPGLVEEGAPVVRAALRLDHEDDALRHLDRDAERARILVRPVLEVELDVLLGAQLDAEVGERPLERGQHPVLRERRVPGDAAPDARDVPALQLAEAEADPGAEEAVAGLLPEPLGLGEERAALLGEVVERVVEAAVELRVASARRAARSPGGRPAPPAGGADSARPRSASFRARSSRSRVARSSSLPIRGRSIRYGTSSPATRRLQRRLELGDALGLLADEVAEVALAGEPPQLAGVAAEATSRSRRARARSRASSARRAARRSGRGRSRP